MRRSSRSSVCDSRREGEAQVGVQRALVELVEHDGADAFSAGSGWSMRASTPSVTTSIRVARPDPSCPAHPVADGFARPLAQRPAIRGRRRAPPAGAAPAS